MVSITAPRVMRALPKPLSSVGKAIHRPPSYRDGGGDVTGGLSLCKWLIKHCGIRTRNTAAKLTNKESVS